MPNFNDLIEIYDHCTDEVVSVIPALADAVQMPDNPNPKRKTKIFDKATFTNFVKTKYAHVPAAEVLAQVQEYHEGNKLATVPGTRLPTMLPAGRVLAMAIVSAHDDITRFLDAAGVKASAEEDVYKQRLADAIKLDLKKAGANAARCEEVSSKVSEAAWSFSDWIGDNTNAAILAQARKDIETLTKNSHLPLADAKIPALVGAGPGIPKEAIDPLSIQWLRLCHVHEKNFGAAAAPAAAVAGPEAAQLHATIAQLKRDLSDATATAEGNELLMQGYWDRAEQLERQIQALKNDSDKERAELQRQLGEARGIQVQLQRQLAEAQGNLFEANRDHQRVLNEQRQGFEAQRRELIDLRAKLDQVNEAKNDLHAHVDPIIAQLAAAEAELKRVKQQAVIINRERQDAQAALAAGRARPDGALAEGERDLLEARVQEQGVRANALEARLLDSIAAHEMLGKDYELLRAQNQELEGRMRNLRAAQEEAQGGEQKGRGEAFEQYQQVLQAYRNDADGREAELRNLRAQLREANARLDAQAARGAAAQAGPAARAPGPHAAPVRPPVAGAGPHAPAEAPAPIGVPAAGGEALAPVEPHPVPAAQAAVAAKPKNVDRRKGRKF